MLKRLYHSRLAFVLVCILLAVLYLVRIINLDQDLPPWGVGLYQPADEGAYAMLAINDRIYGTMNPINILYPSYSSLHLRMNLLGNLLAKMGLSIWGNNYYGLRLPMVLLGMFNLILLSLIIKILVKKYQIPNQLANWGLAGILLIFCTSFTYFLGSRTVETSLMRMTFILLFFLAFIFSKKSGTINYILMGAVAVTSIFLVYLTNIFLLLAIFLFLLFIWYSQGLKKAISAAIAFIIGASLCYALCEVFYRLMWNTSALGNVLASIREYSEISGYNITGVTGQGSFLASIIKNGLKFFGSNAMIYMPIFLLVFFISLPVLLYAVFRKKDVFVCLNYAMIISFLLQTLASEDYIVRKFLVILPCFVINLLFAFYYRNTYTELQKALSGRFLFLRNEKIQKVIYLAWIVLSLVSIIIIYMFRLSVVDDGTRLDMSRIDTYSIYLLGLLPLVIYLLYGLFCILKNKKINHQGILFIVCCTLLLNINFLVRHNFIAPTYSERNAMIAMGPYVNGKYVLGGFSISYTLYNDMKPVVTTKEMTRIYMQKDANLLLLDYEDTTVGMRDYFDNTVFLHSPITAFLEREIDRSFQAFNSKRNMALYSARPKEEVVSIYQNRFFDKMLTLKQNERKTFNNIQSLSLTEQAKYVEELENKRKTVGFYPINPYPDIYGDVFIDIWDNIYVDVRGSIYGDVYGDIYGDVYGDIYGNVYGDVYGNVYGKIYSEIDLTQPEEAIEE